MMSGLPIQSEILHETTIHSIGERTSRKIRLRILPFIFFLYVIAYLDRINIGFAALTMNKELGITSQQFGLLAGLFFLAYFLFEVPSNLLLHRIGARIWIARILITWGAVAMLTGFARTAGHLYVLRFLLGLAEAGYFPGMILYLTYWFPQREQARTLGLFLTGLPIATILGGPASGLILDHAHWLGVSSWRWLLLLEGVPAVICGLLTYFLLPSRPNEARFLSAEEKEWIQAELGREEQRKLQRHQYSVVQALMNGRVLLLAVMYFGLMTGSYTLTLWAPQLVKSLSSGYSNGTVGLLVMIPSLLGLVALVLVSRSSDRLFERRYHVAIPAVTGGIGLILLGTAHAPLVSLVLLCVFAIGVYSSLSPFWAMPSEFLTGDSAAAGIALVNSVGNLGGFVGPYAIGAITQRTGSLHSALAFPATALFMAAILAMLVPKEHKPA